MRRLLALILLIHASACVHTSNNPYTDASDEVITSYKEVSLPLLPGTQFYLSQGAFGKYTHHDPGEEYKWDFDVPYGTPVIAVESGVVLSVWEPKTGGGCDPRYNEDAHNLKIQHTDGTVAQYTHVKSHVHTGQYVNRGSVIAETAKNGFICSPQLCFSVYRSASNLHGSLSPQTIPLRFSAIKGGLLREGTRYKIPGVKPN